MEKKPYQTPELIIWGTIEQLTTYALGDAVDSLDGPNSAQ
jgi:hypothetical protein